MLLYQSNNLEFGYNYELGTNTLEFVFKGELTEQTAFEAAEVWVNEFENNPTKSFTIIWDCQDMTSFAPVARDVWHECIQYQRRQIEEVVVASDSNIILGIAKLIIGSATKLTIGKADKELVTV